MSYQEPGRSIAIVAVVIALAVNGLALALHVLR